jgi:DNA primase
MDQIDEVRSKVDIVELINSYVPLKRSGRNYKALCPFHSEKTPSFMVSPELQIFKCFGCGKGGDAFKFLMEYEGMTFGEALRELAEKVGVKLESYQPSKKQQFKDKLLEINHLASEFYHYLLTKHQVGEKARRYLKKRGVRNDSVKQFKLGWAPDSWRNLLQYLGEKKGYKPQLLEKAGLVIEKRKQYTKKKNSIKNFYDRFRGRIIFPLKNHRGEVVGFSGRTLAADPDSAKYINSPETFLYHKADLLYGLSITKQDVREQKEAIVMEGELDLISSYQAGVKNVVAVKGSSLTENQVNLIKRFADTIVFCMDADSAGDKATRRGINTAEQAGLNVRVIEIAEGKDPDDLAQESAKKWREKAKKTIPVFDFFINSAVRRHDSDSPEGKKKISEELMPVFADINNEVLKSHYIKKLSEKLDIREEALLRELARKGKQKKFNNRYQKKRKKPQQKKEKKKRREGLEEYLLSLVLQKTAERGDLIEDVEIDKIETLAVKKILKHLEEFLQENDYDVGVFAKQLPAELQETVNRLYLEDNDEVLTDERKFNQEFGFVTKQIKKMFFKSKLKQLQKELKAKENKGEETKVLQRKVAKLTKKLSFLQ